MKTIKHDFMKYESAGMGMQVAILVDFDQEGGGFPTAITGIGDALRGVGLVGVYAQRARPRRLLQSDAGGDAVVAACHAAPPFNRQLDMMRLQSGAVMRCMLLDRLKKTFQLSARTSLRFSRGPEVAFQQSAQFMPKHVT